MISDEDRASILSFATSTDKNLELALGVLSIRDEIRKKAIQNFLAKLGTQLAAHSGQAWKVDARVEPGDLFNKYWLVSITQESWEQLYRIGIEPLGNGPSGFILGVRNDLQRLPEGWDQGKIAEVVEVRAGKGSTSAYWPYYRYIERDLSDWSNPQTLARLLGREGDAVAENLAKLLNAIAESAKETIDDCVRLWRETHSGR